LGVANNDFEAPKRNTLFDIPEPRRHDVTTLKPPPQTPHLSKPASRNPSGNET
jgi:hypothetical protein